MARHRTGRRPCVSLLPSPKDLDEAVAFQLALGPAGEIVREAGALGERTLPELQRALRAMLARFLEDGGVFLPAGAWIVHARR